MNKKTLEEVVERLYPFTKDDSENRIITIKRLFWIEGAKWQQEQDKNKYSEEDMKLAFEAGHKKGFSGYPNTENWKELPFEEWFKQFKNK